MEVRVLSAAQIVKVMETKRVILNEDGTLDKFAVSDEQRDLIMALEKHHKWIKEQTLSDKITLNIGFPDEDKTISITW